MQKCNDQINMDYSRLMQSPVTESDIQSYNEDYKKAYKASDRFCFNVMGLTWLIFSAALIAIVFEANQTTEDIIYYLSISLFGSTFFAAFVGVALSDDYVTSRSPAFTWSVKSKNTVGFQDGIKQLSDNEYIELKALADQNGSVMNYVKTIASQGRKPIKAELCMLKNYMDQYPATHAKQVLGLA